MNIHMWIAYIHLWLALFPYAGKYSHTWHISKEQCFKLNRNKLAFHKNQNQAGKNLLRIFWHLGLMLQT